jgi:hypothetical protein
MEGLYYESNELLHLHQRLRGLAREIKETIAVFVDFFGWIHT